MNADVKKLWVEALRSGEYKQGKHCLRDADRYCCLGVLCDLYARATETPWAGDMHYDYDDSGVLPAQVQQWAGLASANPIRSAGQWAGHSLAELNDETEASFNELADIIDADAWEDDGITHAP